MKTGTILREILLTPAMGVLGVLLLPMCLWMVAVWALEHPSPARGKSYEMWETADQIFKVRATAYYETDLYLPGAYFAFESAPLGSNQWREFVAFRVDDPIPIPRERLRFLNEETAYVFMSDGYVVTVDGGRTWSMWKPILPQSNGQNVYWAIKELQVELNGTGAAKLWRYDEQVKSFVYLDVRTEDFGRHWSAV